MGIVYKMISILFALFLVCNTLPTEKAKTEQRSLFEDVIKSIKINSQFSDDSASINENGISQQYNFYGDKKHINPLMPTDFQFLPRRNDRIELPSLRYRVPKNQQDKTDEVKIEIDKKEKDEPQEIVIHIDTHKYASKISSSTSKPKKSTTKRQKPNQKDKPKTANIKNETYDEDIADDSEIQETSTDQLPMPHRPQNNNMSGQSQIGNRESQMVIKPTVIVNFRGSVTNKDSDIRLEGRNSEENGQPVPNVFNINQDVHIDKTYAIVDHSPADNKHNVKKEKYSAKYETKVTEFDKDETEKEISKVIAETNTKIEEINDNNKKEILIKEEIKDSQNRTSRVFIDGNEEELISVQVTVEAHDENHPIIIKLQ